LDPKKFFSELKRRNVYRAAVGYTAVAWLLIQVATQTLPFFDMPTGAVRLIIVVLIAGFPVALALAWAFELTPEGIIRAEDAPKDQPALRDTQRKIDFAIIGVLALAVAVLLFDRLRPRDAAPGYSVPEKSIAVLPFTNMSDEKENAFFADGIQDDILTSLAKIRDLKVISRTSVIMYRDGGARNLREIGRALGVAHVLEGSVRGSGNRVKVTVQLIDARDDRHVWAESYDETISDALTAQGQLATKIASALHATLSPEEKARVERKHTENPDAYVLYLRARQLEINPDTLLQDFKAAVQLYGEAVKLDPSFALAHARLSATMARIYHFYEPTAEWRERAIAAAREALRLQPNMGEAHYAQALAHYWLDSDYERALASLGQAARLLPNDSEIGLINAAIARRQGRWSEAIALFQKVEAIDPQNANVVRNLVYTYGAVRDWDSAVQAAARLNALVPNSVGARMQAAYMDFFRKGSTAALEAFLDSTPAEVDPDGAVTAARWDVWMIKRDFAAAEGVMQASRLAEFSYLNGHQTPKAYFIGCAALAAGDAKRAQQAFDAARPSFEEAVKQAPHSATRRANLGLLYAFMGRKEDAIREGRRATELRPESQDALDGTLMSSYLALIYARVGEHDEALKLIERLLQTPGASDSVHYSVSVQDLRHRCEWDPLRSHPRFRELIGE
jgi:TolB-like protein/lipopolysaccharide biosynthesis regulator YciM